MEPRTRTQIALAVVVLGLGLVGAAAFLLRSRPGELPPPKMAPPLDSVAKKYPSLKKVIDDPKLGSVLKEFVAAYESGGVDGAKRFAKDRGFMNADDDITLTILTETDDTAQLEAELKAEVKAQIVGRGDQSIDVIIPWSSVDEQIKAGKKPDEVLERLSKATNVRGVLPMDRPAVHQKRTNVGDSTEGVKVTRADQWHKAGFRGAGVRVGILDPEVSKASMFAGTAFPAGTPVYPGGCVRAGVPVDDEGLHGAAAAEIVSTMAPDAQLFIACSAGDDDAAINWLVSQGVKIISYSAGGMYGRRNGKGRLQQKIDSLARQQNILWVNSSGNDGETFHRGELSGGAPNYLHSFAPGRTALGFQVSRETTIKATLIWNHWDSAVVSDYQLIVLDSGMREVARSDNNNTIIRQPLEQVATRLRPGGYYVAIRGGSSTTKKAPFVLNVHGAASIEQNTPQGSLAAPADALGAFAVGGVVWNTDKLAAYSSRGPTEDGRVKPEISAPTHTASVVYKGTFGGTSAAAPHVAGAAAVVWGRFPQFTRDDVANFLMSRARDLGAAGPDNDYGAGRLDLGDPATASAPPKVAVVPTTPGKPPVATPSSPSSGVLDGIADLFKTFAIVVGLGALGVLLVLSAIIWLIVSMVRGRKRPAPAPAWPVPAYPGGAPAGYAAPNFGAPQPAHRPPPPRPAPPPAQRPAPPAATPPRPPPAAPAPAPARPPPAAPMPAPSHVHVQADALTAPPADAVVPPPVAPVGTVAPTMTMDVMPAPEAAPAPAVKPAQARLVAVAGPTSGATVPLILRDTTIGRGPTNVIIVVDSRVSSHHAVVQHTAQGYMLVDKASVNGTFVNGRRVQQHMLREGDLIAIGPSTFKFEG